MENKDLMKLLDEVQEPGENTPKEKRIILIDALNLFFRNFAVIGVLNSDGTHIGGLGGFLRSLGALIRNLEADQVYVVFDGIGGSNNRKNIIPEYKSGRNNSRITNWEVFDSHEDEENSQIDQIIRIAQYLKTLPVKTVAIDKVEADDVIAYVGEKLSHNKENKVFIVSSDKDYLQLAKDNLIIYRPIEKRYYTPSTIKEKFGCPASNFILYKLLMGDSSDKIEGVKFYYNHRVTVSSMELSSISHSSSTSNPRFFVVECTTILAYCWVTLSTNLFTGTSRFQVA